MPVIQKIIVQQSPPYQRPFIDTEMQFFRNPQTDARNGNRMPVNAGRSVLNIICRSRKAGIPAKIFNFVNDCLFQFQKA